MKTQGIFLSWIVVENIEAAIKFYTQVVGLKLKEWDKQFGWAELSGPEGSMLGICQQNTHMDLKAGTNAVVTISVDDIEATRQDFMRKGIKLIGEIMEVPGHVKLQTFLDSDGNRMQLVQEL